MDHFKETLQAHPSHSSSRPDLGELISVLGECALTCRACADACLAEPMVDQLRRCISTDLACAETCQALAKVLTQQTTSNPELLAALGEACRIICGACGEECDKHAEKHAHCKHCARICRECEQQCAKLGAS